MLGFKKINLKPFVSHFQHPSVDVKRAQKIEAGAAGLVPGCAGIRGCI